MWNSSKNIPGEIQAEATAKRDEKCTNEEKKWLLAMNSKSRPSTNHMQQSLLDIVLAIKVWMDYFILQLEVNGNFWAWRFFLLQATFMLQ